MLALREVVASFVLCAVIFCVTALAFTALAGVPKVGETIPVTMYGCGTLADAETLAMKMAEGPDAAKKYAFVDETNSCGMFPLPEIPMLILSVRDAKQAGYVIVSYRRTHPTTGQVVEGYTPVAK